MDAASPHNSSGDHGGVVIITGSGTTIATGRGVRIAGGAGGVITAGAAAVSTNSAGSVKITGAVGGAFSNQMRIPSAPGYVYRA
jgi:hypothetical protein